MSDLLSELLVSRDYLLADGATGTNMFAMGLATKRMFPLVICFLPGLFVWTLGPVFIQLIQMADTFTQVRNF